MISTPLYAQFNSTQTLLKYFFSIDIFYYLKVGLKSTSNFFWVLLQVSDKINLISDSQ